MILPGTKLVLATRNSDKIVEIHHVLNGFDIELLSIADYDNIPDIIEDGNTLEENAIKKAKRVAQYTNLPALADDTGLEVDCLGGAPGVYSSRFAGANASYADNVKLLLKKMQGVPKNQRNALFRCIITLADGNDYQTVEGSCEGIILEEPRGKNGFGYDPVFYVKQYHQTFAEMPLELKNKISHRGIALRKAKDLIEKKLTTTKIHN